MALPLISVITPTWQRHEVLLKRCIPSVEAQTYPYIEHIVVSDGYDPELSGLVPLFRTDCWNRWYWETGSHDEGEHWGHYARNKGLAVATGELVTYCDDDDRLRPEHCSLLATALMEHPEADFALSRMASHDAWDKQHIIGEGPPSCGNLGSPMLMHRSQALKHGTWGPASPSEDWDLVNRWLQAGLQYVQIDEVTSDVWPSIFYSGRP